MSAGSVHTSRSSAGEVGLAGAGRPLLHRIGVGLDVTDLRRTDREMFRNSGDGVALARSAHAAMYRAQQGGRNAFCCRTGVPQGPLDEAGGCSKAS